MARVIASVICLSVVASTKGKVLRAVYNKCRINLKHVNMYGQNYFIVGPTKLTDMLEMPTHVTCLSFVRQKNFV